MNLAAFPSPSKRRLPSLVLFQIAWFKMVQAIFRDLLQWQVQKLSQGKQPAVSNIIFYLPNPRPSTLKTLLRVGNIITHLPASLRQNLYPTLSII